MPYADISKLKARRQGDHVVYRNPNGGFVGVYDQPQPNTVTVYPWYDEDYVPENGTSWWSAVCIPRRREDGE